MEQKPALKSNKYLTNVRINWVVSAMDVIVVAGVFKGWLASLNGSKKLTVQNVSRVVLSVAESFDVARRQCDQIGRFIALWATFISWWQ